MKIAEPWQPLSHTTLHVHLTMVDGLFTDDIELEAMANFVILTANRTRLNPTAMRKLASVLCEGADVLEARISSEVHPIGPHPGES